MKPKLSISQQMEHLEEKGITFIECSKQQAQIYLRNMNYYYKVTSYRKNFLQYPHGIHKGKYIYLDFGHLVDLAEIDEQLREILLDIALNIEHYAKVKLLQHINDNEKEDGYTIIQDFFDSLDPFTEDKLKKAILGKSNGLYVGDMITHYAEHYPIWVFVKIISFGSFLRLYRFCGKHWNNKQLLSNFYDLKDVKELRNAAAHSNCILNDITIKKSMHHRPNQKLLNHLKPISTTRNKNHLSKDKVRQIATLLYVSDYMITNMEVKEEINKKLKLWTQRIYKNYDYKFNESLRATFDYLIDVIDIFYPIL